MKTKMMKTFPFGMPVEPIRQVPSGHRKVFVLGVYASAVHARWIRPDGTIAIKAVAVASEPEIFWRGDGADAAVKSVPLPDGAGSLVVASEQFNGPSGRALDDYFLSPLRIDRNDAWLCDLLPESRCNPDQAAALEREYRPAMARLGLPAYDFPAVPSPLVDSKRISEIENEIFEASPELLITLGDQPLKWFARHFGSKPQLSAYGELDDNYGRLHQIVIGGKKLGLLPLVHPRQAAKLGGYSPKWYKLHSQWVRDVAPTLVSASG